ncbi:MAG TPA: hypothetical protein VGP64_17420 [Polyangia bacterium]|jgi:hypothetical protein
MKSARFADILRALATERVEFIVVGMTAGVLAGAPVTTLDVDIVHRRTPENVTRLLKVLEHLGSTYRHDPRELRPTSGNLMSPGHQLLTTDWGDLDCLGTIDDGQDYESLLPSTREIALAEGLTIRVLDLPRLIEVKRRAGRPKDLAQLPVLEATLEERNRRGDPT